VPTPKIPRPTGASYRFAVLSAVSATGFLLIKIGFPAATALAIALIASAGAVEVACWLTAPEPAFGIRVRVVILILIVIIRLLELGQPAAPVLLAVIGGSLCVAWIARRLTDPCHSLPRVQVII
jgi:hypothetical protein